MDPSQGMNGLWCIGGKACRGVRRRKWLGMRYRQRGRPGLQRNFDLKEGVFMLHDQLLFVQSRWKKEGPRSSIFYHSPTPLFNNSVLHWTLPWSGVESMKRCISLQTNFCLMASLRAFWSRLNIHAPGCWHTPESLCVGSRKVKGVPYWSF